MYENVNNLNKKWKLNNKIMLEVSANEILIL